jgi:hypothetical protein
LSVNVSQPDRGTLTLNNGGTLIVRAFDRMNRDLRLVVNDGVVGVGVDGDVDDAGLIDGDKLLVFMFPFDEPTIVVRLVLSSFDPPEQALLEFDRGAGTLAGVVVFRHPHINCSRCRFFVRNKIVGDSRHRY